MQALYLFFIRAPIEINFMTDKAKQFTSEEEEELPAMGENSSEKILKAMVP